MKPTQTQMGAVLPEPRLARIQEMRQSILGLVDRFSGPQKDKNLLRESLIAPIVYGMEQGRSQFGATLHDPFADSSLAMPEGAKASTIYVSPFPHASVVSDVAVTYAIPETQDVYVLLERKWKDPAHPERGLQDEFILPGGHLEAHTPGEAGITTRPYDHDLAATVRRELREETHLSLPEHYAPKSIGVGSEYGVNGDPREHPLIDFRHVNMSGSAADFEQLKQTMKADSDAAEIRWVNARDLGFHPEAQKQAFGSTLSRYHVTTEIDGQKRHLILRDDHGEMLDKAVSIARQRLVSEHQKNIGQTQETAAIPASAFGAQADALHRENIAALSKMRPAALGAQGGFTDKILSERAASTHLGPQNALGA